jgi:hypothetical protein
MAARDKGGSSYRFVVLGVASALVVLFAGASVILAVGHAVPTEMWAAASALSGAFVGILVPSKPAEAAGRAVADAGATSAGAAAAKTAAAAQPAAMAVEVQAAQRIAFEATSAVDLRERANEALCAMNQAAGAAENAGEAEQEILPKAVTKAIARHAVLAAAADAAERTDEAVTAAVGVTRPPTSFLGIRIKTTLDLKAVLLLIVFVVALGIGILLAFHAGDHTEATATVSDIALKNASGTLIALASAAGGALVGLAAPSPEPTGKGGT